MPAPDLLLLEFVLKDLSERSIEQFAADHPDEAFYAFGFDCNVVYGVVLLCVNTEADFAKTSAEYIAKWDYGAEDLAELRRNFGDWQYQGFNLKQDAWNKSWEPYQASIHRYVHDDDTDDDTGDAFIEEFLKMVCRVLVQIEQSGVLDSLHREEGFFTLVIDHDEDEEAAGRRLAAERARMVA